MEHNHVDLLYGDETFIIRGCMMRVYNELGSGFLEKVYQEALAIELENAQMDFQREANLTISYRGMLLNQRYTADFVCCNKIIVEVKAVAELNASHIAQVMNYLKATNYDLGLLVNFGAERLQIKRIINYHK